MSISMVLDKWTRHVHTTEWSVDVKTNDKVFFCSNGVYIDKTRTLYKSMSYMWKARIYLYILICIDSHTQIHSFSQN